MTCSTDVVPKFCAEVLNVVLKNPEILVEVGAKGARSLSGGWGSPAVEDGDVEGKVLAPVLGEAPAARRKQLWPR